MDIETPKPGNDPQLQEDFKAIRQSRSTVDNLVLSREAEVEIKLNDFGSKQVSVRHNGSLIYSTEDPEEIARFEQYLKDPEKFVQEEAKNFSLREAERTLDTEAERFRKENLTDIDEGLESEENF